MPLSAGDKLGPYEILAPIGEGGMGEVYRALDTRLGREVALKVSSARFTERFEREAKAIAALNHPNICHLYDVGPNFLVMELIEGPTLGEKVAEGPIPVEEAIRIARQIADGLQEAHSKGIIHRDLKPGNVKIKPDGTVKVLDFGLAKMGPAVENASDSPRDPDLSPTVSLNAATEVGMVLGTAGYMSPQQAMGKQVDKRADIWAFGVVLFEMLTGKRPFQGEDASATLAAVITEEPDYARVNAQLRPLLQMCLRKDPTKRLNDITAAKLMLEQVQESSSQPIQAAPAAKGSGHSMIWAAAAVVVLAISGGAAWFALRPKPEQPMYQMEISPPEGVKFVSPLTPFALSPDGRKLAFVGAGKDGKRMLWLRPIDSEAATALPGTEGAEVPFWSPDSRWVGFSANGKLQKIEIAGGSQPQVICDIEGRAGGTWNRDGVILFPQGGKPLQRVSASGGTPTSVLPIDASPGEGSPGAPYFLPDGQHFLYYTSGKSGGSKFASLDGKLNRVLIKGGQVASYAPNPRGGGWLVYNVRNQLLARPLDPVTGEFSGPSAVIADAVGIARWWSASANGIIAFRHDYGSQYQLAWFGRDGRQQGTIGDSGDLATPRISPDQKTIAFRRTSEQNTDVWTFDLTRNTAARFTFEPGFDAFPLWSPDSKRIVHYSNRNGSLLVVERPENGVGSEVTIANRTGEAWYPTGESRDGHWLAFVETNPVHSVIVLRSREDPNKIVRIQGRETELDGSISPDGRWLLYSSAPASRREIIVQSMPQEVGGAATAPGRWQITTAGGSQPMWRADGREIFYAAPDGMMMVVPIESGESLFRPGAPKPLFQTRLPILEQGQASDIVFRQYDVTSDGQRFLLNQRVADAIEAPITVVVNWPKLLDKH